MTTKPRDWVDAAMALAAALAVAVQLVPAPQIDLMQRDSQGYLDFSPTRTAGYPLFLRAVEHLPGGLAALPLLQLSLYGLAALLLAAEFRRLTQSKLAGGALLVLLLGNTQVTRLSFMIMTEALFLAFLMLLLAALCRLARSPRWQMLAVASLIAGVAVLVRPAGYALLLSLPGAAWWSGRGGFPWPRALFAAALPCLAVLAMGMVAYHAVHGLWRTQSFLGSNLFGKAAAVIDTSPAGQQAPDIGWMAACVAPDRAVIDRAPSWVDRFRLLGPYYDIWRWDTLYRQLPARTGIAAGDAPALDAAMLRLSLRAIGAAPAAYAAEVARTYGAMWWLPDAMTGAELARFRALLAALGPLPDLGEYPPWHQHHSDAVVWALHGFMMLALA
ncbi:MAG: hypothetical protein JO258_11980, partial [Alphaproteobacteria bacterium]|nr:hypothetical protein [Alphaproteobacteria bacterium]